MSDLEDWGDDEQDHGEGCECIDCVLEDAVDACSQFADGGYWGCGAAGSEWCDWDCPFSDSIGEEVEDAPTPNEVER